MNIYFYSAVITECGQIVGHLDGIYEDVVPESSKEASFILQGVKQKVENELRFSNKWMNGLIIHITNFSRLN